jgi:hypothetical protein
VGNAITRDRPVLLQLLIEQVDFMFALRPIDPTQADELLGKLSEVYKYESVHIEGPRRFEMLRRHKR